MWLKSSYSGWLNQKHLSNSECQIEPQVYWTCCVYKMDAIPKTRSERTKLNIYFY
jgi:hypothetical protein